MPLVRPPDVFLVLLADSRTALPVSPPDPSLGETAAPSPQRAEESRAGSGCSGGGPPARTGRTWPIDCCSPTPSPGRGRAQHQLIAPGGRARMLLRGAPPGYGGLPQAPSLPTPYHSCHPPRDGEVSLNPLLLVAREASAVRVGSPAGAPSFPARARAGPPLPGEVRCNGRAGGADAKAAAERGARPW